jgi:hypothetical protein
LRKSPVVFGRFPVIFSTACAVDSPAPPNAHDAENDFLVRARCFDGRGIQEIRAYCQCRRGTGLQKPPPIDVFLNHGVHSFSLLSHLGVVKDR